MKKRLYAILLAASVTGALAAGSAAVYADETEGAAVVEEESVITGTIEAGNETEAESEAVTEAAGLEPASVTGDTSYVSMYPTIEAQVEQELTSLSQMSLTDVEQMITTYNKQINLSVRDIANSMGDSSTLTDQDDSTMATVKMLRNWYSVMDTCGAFEGVESYTADMTDGVLTLVLDTDYSDAAKNSSTVSATFTYDVSQGVSLITWDVKESFGSSMRKAALNTLIGLGTVFIVLLFLSFLIGQIHWIPDLLNRRKNEQEAAQAAAPAPAAVPDAAVEETADETDDLELVAVITAAIAAGDNAPADGFVVRSIRRRGKRAGWRA